MASRSSGPAGATTATRSPGWSGWGLRKRGGPVMRRYAISRRLSYPPAPRTRSIGRAEARLAARRDGPRPGREGQSQELRVDGDEEAALAPVKEHQHGRPLRVIIEPAAHVVGVAD